MTQVKFSTKYESTSFGEYGRRVRIFRLTPHGNFYIEYDGGRQRRVIRPKTKSHAEAMVYAARLYENHTSYRRKTEALPPLHVRHVPEDLSTTAPTVARAIFLSKPLIELPDDWPSLGIHELSRMVCEYYGTAQDPEQVYFIQDPGTRRVKIGRAKNVELRFAAIQASCPTPLTVLVIVRGGGVLERILHKLFDNHRLHGEWFEWNDTFHRFLDAR